MDEGLRAAIVEEGEAMQLRVRQMPCGAGHDAAVFAQRGVPSAMIFVRNDNGSHNPNEAMDLADFAVATRLLGRVLARERGERERPPR
jgi:N-carbamoyl-L-amino-acid hydrolase